MNSQRIIRGIFIVASIAGAAILVILLGIAVVLYLIDQPNYDKNMLPLILIPFDIVLLATFGCGTFLFLWSDEHKHH